ncbi:hypothetical protein QTP88_004514 [Uroleucon formosanum]
MLKLIRNAWNNKTIILNSKGEEINWKYIELNEIEQEEGLRLGTKLTKRHVYFHSEVVNVSQDHIETTFSAIRSRLGYNNNPTCQQFKAAYKRILVHNEIVGSQFGNCTLLDKTKNLTADSSVIEK